MKLKEILSVVAEVTEIAEDLIVSKSKKEDVVLAKKLFVLTTKKLGYPTSAIAKLLGVTEQAVRYLNNGKDSRKIVTSKLKEIAQRVTRD